MSRRLLAFLGIFLCLQGLQAGAMQDGVTSGPQCQISKDGDPASQVSCQQAERHTDGTGPTVFADGFESDPIPEDGDATIIAGPGIEPTSIDSVHVGPLVVLDFQIVDGGLSDGLSTEVIGLVVRQTGQPDASIHTWTLAGDDISGSVTGVVMGPVGDQTITFSGLTISVPDGGVQSYALSLELGPPGPGTQDNDKFLISISGDDATLGMGTTMQTNTPVTNGTGLTFEVIATELGITTQPGPVEHVGVGFDVVAEYRDAAGNVDRDVNGDFLTAMRSDFGAVISGTSAPAANGVAAFTGPEQIVLGEPGNISGLLHLSIQDDVGSSIDLSGVPVDTEFFVLISGDDEDAGLIPGPAPEPLEVDSVGAAAAPVAFMDFTVSDGGTSDGLSIDITEVSVQHSGSADASEHNWTLEDPGLSSTPGIVSGTVPNQTITFSGLSLSVPDLSSRTFAIELQLQPTPLATADNQDFVISLDTSDITSTGTSLAAGSPVTNGPGTSYVVNATDLMVIQQPSPNEVVGVPFDVTAGFVDANNNLDLDINGNVLTATRSDASTVNQGTSAATVGGIAAFTGANQVELGAPIDESGSLFLVLSDGITGFSVNSNTFTLSDSNDGDAVIRHLDPPSFATSIDSVVGTSSPVEILRFEVADGGTSDELAANIDSLVVDVTGPADAADHFWTLTGPGANVAGLVSGPVGNQQILFSGLSIAVPDGAASEFGLDVQLAVNPPGTQDGQVLGLSIDSSNIVSGGGTNFAASSVSNSPGLTYEVVATELALIDQPPGVAQVGVGFDLDVSYVDSNGNVDTSVPGEIAVVTRTDAGTVIAGTSAGAVSGVASFTGANQIILGGPAGNLALVVADDPGGLLTLIPTVNTDNFDLLVTPDSDAVLSPGPLSEPTTIDQSTAGTDIAVLDFMITDGGTLDGQATVITEIVMQVDGSADASEHDWSLIDGMTHAGIVEGSAPDVTVRFTGLNTSVPDGGSETLTVRLNLNASPGNTVHRDDFLLSVSTDDMTLGTGTQFGAPAAVTNGSGLEYLFFSIQLSSTDAGCEGVGTATVAVTGGRQPVAVSWDHNGASTTTIADLIPALYSVTVTDNGGDVLQDSVTVTSECSDTTYCDNGFPPGPLVDIECGVICATDDDCNGLMADDCVNGTCGQFLFGPTGAFFVTTDEGIEYTVTTCFAPQFSNELFDTQLTAFDSAGFFAIYNDDLGATCAIPDEPLDGLQSGLMFVAPLDETYHIELNEYNCGTSSGNESATIGITCQ